MYSTGPSDWADIGVNEFELQSRYYVHFQTNTFVKRCETPYLSVMGAHTVLSGRFYYQITQKFDMPINKETKLKSSFVCISYRHN